MNNNTVEYTDYLKIKDLGIDEDGIYHLEVKLEAIHLSRAGLVHGGFIFTLLDAAIGRAVIHLAPENHTAPTIEMKVNFFRPAASGTLRAQGKVINQGKTLYYAEGEVSNEDGKLIARSSGTFFVKPRHD